MVICFTPVILLAAKGKSLKAQEVVKGQRLERGTHTPARYADRRPEKATPCASKGPEKGNALPNGRYPKCVSRPPRISFGAGDPRSQMNRKPEKRRAEISGRTDERQKASDLGVLESDTAVGESACRRADAQAWRRVVSCRSANVYLTRVQNKDKRGVLECSVTPNRQRIVVGEGN